MLPPDFLETLPDDLVRIMETLEDEILEDICARIAENDALTGTAINDIEILFSQGLNLDEIQKAIAEKTGIALNEIDRIFEQAVEEAKSFSDNVKDFADVAIPQNAVAAIEAEASAIAEQIKNDVFNITQTMGFAITKAGYTQFCELDEAFQQILNEAAVAVGNGYSSYNEAVKKAVKALADSGIKTIGYDSGHTDSVDVAVRRAVMTGINQVSAKYAELYTDYLHTDLVETTAHRGARSKQGPNGWEAHTRWQGRVFRWSDKPRTSQGEYPDFVSSTGYGHVTGLCGANCRHNFYPYIEGVSKRTYTNKQLASIDPPPFSYQGKEYNAYEATQMQRTMERALRRSNRRITAYQAAGLQQDAQDEKIAYRRLLSQYVEFSEAADLPTQPARIKPIS